MKVFFLGAGEAAVGVVVGTGLNETGRNRKATGDLSPTALQMEILLKSPPPPPPSLPPWLRS